jgi:hypothetical protein
MIPSFGFRLLVVSIANYLFGNFLFALLWIISAQRESYWVIAIISTFFASMFSYQTQSRGILRTTTQSVINLRYISFQLFGLAFAIVVIPSISSFWQIDIIFVQFGWSAFFSLISLLLLIKRKFSSKVSVIID